MTKMTPEYDPKFMARQEADACFKAMAQLPWNQHQINMYGKTIPAPRMFVWMGTPPPKLYGKPVPITPWTAEATELIKRVEAATGVLFDSLNINMYRNNDDYLGWHIDPEDEGRWDFPIVSVTLGAERMFQWRPYKLEGRKRVPEGETEGRVLGHGSMLTMPPGFQAAYVHRLPKVSSKSGMRINMTFRRMTAPAS